MDILGNFSHLPGDKNKRKAYTRKEEAEFSYSDIAYEGVTKIETKTASFSLVFARVALVFIFALLVLRLFSLQVVQGEANQKLAEGNRIRPRIIEATRGLITDNQGSWLARNVPDFALALYPSDLPKKKIDREEVYNQLSSLSGLPAADIKKQAEENGLLSLDMIVLMDHIEHDRALIMEKKIASIQGAVIAKKYSREYAVLPGISHLLGYTGKISKEDLENDSSYFLSDRVGKTGLEYQYESDLKGDPGVEQIEVDSKGNIIRILMQDGNREPEPGSEVSLYLNQGLQKATADALLKGIEEGKKMTGLEVSSGAVIVMDVKTGGILSQVSLPDYDDNLFANGITNENYKTLIEDPNKPLFNRAVAGVYPPGSIVKIVMAAAGLTEKNITKQTAFDTPSAITIGDYSFPDWKDHGVTDIKRAIAESNNVFFYAIGGGYEKIKGLGIDLIKKYWRLFGLGEKTGIDLPGEAAGLLPDPDWKQKVKNEPWYIGDTYHVSIGQGDLLVTPLQMVRATAAIANNGKLLKPQLVKKIVSPTGTVTKEFGAEVQRENFLDPEVIKTIQEGMRLTITGGSAQNLNDLTFSVAGKTGTAQFLNNAKTHAWFECYAPYEDPEIAIVVLIDGGGGGHEIAAPVAKEIMQYYFANK